MVVLVGPAASGRTAILDHWAQEVSDAAWWQGVAPPPATETLIVDGADRLSEEHRQGVLRWLNEVPTRRVRAAAHDAAALDAPMHIEQVTVLLDLEDVTRLLRAADSPADPHLVQLHTRGHFGSARLVAESKAADAEAMRQALTRTATTLHEEAAVLAIPWLLTPGTADAVGVDIDEVHELVSTGSAFRSEEAGGIVLRPDVAAATSQRFPLDPGIVNAHHEACALALLAEGKAFAALVEAVAAQRLDLVDQAIGRGGMPIVVAHGHQIVRLLGGISPWRLRHHPLTALALALAYNARRQHRVRALELLGIALLGVRGSVSGSAERALLRTVESVALRLSGAGDGGARAAGLVAQYLDELPPDRREAIAHLEPDMRLHAGISLLYADRHAAAREQLEHAVTPYARSAARLKARGAVAVVDLAEGSVHLARQQVAQVCAESWAQEDLDEYPGSMLRIAQASLALEDLDVDAARDHLERLWPMIDTIEHWPTLAHLRAVCDVASGQAELGLERFRQLRAHRSSRLPVLATGTRRLDVTESLLLLALGDLTSASKLRLSGTSSVAARLAGARVAVVRGDPISAVRLLSGSEALLTSRSRFVRDALTVAVHLGLGRHEEAEAAADRVMVLGRSTGLRADLWFLPQDALELVQGLQGAPKRSLLGADKPAPQLTERELVVLSELVRTARLEDIAARLHVSVNTVRSQRRSLYRKLNAHSRETALVAALDHGLLDQ